MNKVEYYNRIPAVRDHQTPDVKRKYPTAFYLYNDESPVKQPSLNHSGTHIIICSN